MSHAVARGAEWACAAGYARYVSKMITGFVRRGGGLGRQNRSGTVDVAGPVIPDRLAGWLRGIAGSGSGVTGLILT